MPIQKTGRCWDESVQALFRMNNNLTLNMIVRDEAETLPNCLKSVQGFIDNIVIIDTGSTDGTPEIAQSFGAQVHHFDWVDDFSAARNYALSKVTTPWTLWLDADDLLQNPEALADITEQAHKNRFTGVWSTYKQDAVCHQRRLQLFKTKAYRWEGVVHESPQVKPGHAQDTVLSDLVVIHRKPQKRCPQAARKYLDILLAKDPNNWIGLAESYKYLALHDSANSTEHLLNADINYLKAWQWEESNADTKYMCLVNLAQLNIQLAETIPERLTLAKRYAQAGIASRPERAECYNFFGHCALKERNPYLAKQAFEKALGLELPSETIGLVYHQHYEAVPKQLLKVAEQMAEDLRIEQAQQEIMSQPSLIWTPGKGTP